VRRIGDTRRLRWLLLVAGLLWLINFFLPGIEWLTDMARRGNPVRSSHVETEIPRAWAVSVNEFGISATRHACIARFCPGETDRAAAFGIRWAPRLRALKVSMERGEARVMEHDGFGRSPRRAMAGTAGAIDCLEGVRDEAPRTAQSHCYADAGLEASFVGDPEALPVFYDAVRAARLLDK